jgi:hypothetical protein
MIQITFPDGNARQFEPGVTSFEIARSISEGLSQKVLAAKVNGEVWDLSRPISKNATLQLLTWDDKDGKTTFWHSTAHLMAEALESLYPNIKFGTGPAIESGFYYDVDTGTTPLSSEDFVKIENEMIRLARLKNQYVRKDISKEEAVSYFTNKGDESFILGDDGAEYSLGLGGTYAFKKNNFLTGKFGYRNPGSDLSDEIYWQIEGALVWKNLALVAGVDGLSSLNNDPYQDNDLDRPILNTGSTFLYNSINRGFISPYAGVNFAFGQTWRIELRGSRPMNGNSTDLGTDFGFSLFRRVEADLKKQSDKTFKEYDFEAVIKKVSPQNGYVVIDKGLADDVQKGTKIDFFEFDFLGGNILVASGIVIQVKSDTSVVKISQIFNDKNQLKEGFVARGKYK